MKPTKRERFVKMAEARTSKALKMIQLIGNLNNRQVYEYSVNDVKKITDALTKAVADMNVSLRDGVRVDFSLGS